ncbi:MAG TPA: beta-N-acetylhexosaminidase [Bacilli bacterium]|nr:beta-N-acetylhexosaminidase [Bacilli bacterium]
MKKLHELTLEEKIGQLFIVGFYGEEFNNDLLHLIKNYKIGNVILFSRNISSVKQLYKLNKDIHTNIDKQLGIMPFITIDQEGGMVTRIFNDATFFPGAMTIGATNINNAYYVGQKMGEELRALGINFNLAPVLDVNNNPHNPVIGVRSYSSSEKEVASYGINYIKGLQEKGIIATAKHFPGHGDTNIDSHLGLPIIEHSKDRLNKIELYPFKKAIDSGLDAIMSAHIVFKAYDSERPATLSKKVLTDLLKKELGFKGLIVSDCMEMKAIDETVTAPKGVLEGLLAGLDMVFVSQTPAKQMKAVELVKEAVLNGKFPLHLLDEKVEKILKYKAKSYELLKNEFFNRNYNEQEKILLDPVTKAKALEIVSDSLTLVKGDNVDPSLKTLVLAPDPFASTIIEDEFSKNDRSIYDMVRLENNPNLVPYRIKIKPSKEEIDKYLELTQDYKQIVLCTYNATINQGQIELVKKLNSLDKKLYVISMRNPFDILNFKEVPNYLALYEYTPNSIKVLISYLNGKIRPKGKLPVSLKENKEYGASVYLGLDDYKLKDNLAYLEKLKANGFSFVFVSMHMPEAGSHVYDEFLTIKDKAKSLGLELIVDVSKPTFDKHKMFGVDRIRLDWGFSKEDIVDLVLDGYDIELNASTLTEELVDYLKERIDLSLVTVSHNFYPKKYTGLKYEDVQKRNNFLNNLGFKVMGYIASLENKRPPLYLGLPTVEAMRDKPVFLQKQEIELLGFSKICFGDAIISDKELKELTEEKEYFTVPLILKKGISEKEKEIINKVHRVRIDQSEYMIRSTKYRGEKGIAPNNTEKRSKYDITIDNDLMKRYSGELNIMLTDLEADKAVNVVGRAILSDFSLDYLKMQTPFVFKIIGEE